MKSRLRIRLETILRKRRARTGTDSHALGWNVDHHGRAFHVSRHSNGELAIFGAGKPVTSAADWEREAIQQQAELIERVANTPFEELRKVPVKPDHQWRDHQ